MTSQYILAQGGKSFPVVEKNSFKDKLQKMVYVESSQKNIHNFA